MAFLKWTISHGFEAVQTFGVIASLFFTGAAFRNEKKSQRLSNLLILTQAHREIWKEVLSYPELARVFSLTPNLAEIPIKETEAVFVTGIILHLGATFRAINSGLFSTEQAIERDVKWFFSLPIPSVVWMQSKDFQEPDFVQFVDRSLGA